MSPWMAVLAFYSSSLNHHSESVWTSSSSFWMIGSWSPQSLFRAQRYTSLIEENQHNFQSNWGNSRSDHKGWASILIWYSQKLKNKTNTKYENRVRNKNHCHLPNAAKNLPQGLWSFEWPPLALTVCVMQDLHLLCFRAVTTRCCSCPSGQHIRQWTCLVLHCTGATSLAQSTPSVSACGGSVRVRIK